MNGTREIILEYYRLSEELDALSCRAAEIRQALEQAQSDRYLAKTAALEYEGSLRSFLHSLSGRQAEKKEALAASLRRADATLAALYREQENLTLRQEQAEAQLRALPVWQAAFSDPQVASLTHRLNARQGIRRLSRDLDENFEALLALRDQLQGKNHSKVMSTASLQAIYSRPDTAAGRCVSLLHQLAQDLEALEIPFALPDYYQNPVMYINAVASDITRRDRVNLAMEQIAALRKQLAALETELEVPYGE